MVAMLACFIRMRVHVHVYSQAWRLHQLPNDAADEWGCWGSPIGIL